jgi:hypothetical protein
MRWSPDRAVERIANSSLRDPISRQPDCIAHAFAAGEQTASAGRLFDLEGDQQKGRLRAVGVSVKFRKVSAESPGPAGVLDWRAYSAVFWLSAELIPLFVGKIPLLSRVAELLRKCL